MKGTDPLLPKDGIILASKVGLMLGPHNRINTDRYKLDFILVPCVTHGTYPTYSLVSDALYASVRHMYRSVVVKRLSAIAPALA